MRTRISAIVAALLIAVILPAAVFAHWPVANRSSYVSQGYWTGHRAYDLAAPTGTEVVPIASGRVIFAGWKNNCGGYQVWINHGNGIYTGYYHLSKVQAWRGEYVKDQTTKIGRVGMSGCATGPHVHTEVWRGKPWALGSYRINPWNYLKAGYWLPYRYR